MLHYTITYRQHALIITDSGWMYYWDFTETHTPLFSLLHSDKKYVEIGCGVKRYFGLTGTICRCACAGNKLTDIKMMDICSLGPIEAN